MSTIGMSTQPKPLAKKQGRPASADCPGANAGRKFPAVALLGPRQAGKTTVAELFAEELASVHLNLEDPADREKPSDAALCLSGHE